MAARKTPPPPALKAASKTPSAKRKQANFKKAPAEDLPLPTVGQVVLYNNARLAAPCPAIVTSVQGQLCVSLTVFTPLDERPGHEPTVFIKGSTLNATDPSWSWLPAKA